MNSSGKTKSGHAIIEEERADLLDALIERWWTDYFPGSAVGHHTAAWNTAHAAKEALKRLIVPRMRGSNREGSI